MSLLGERLAAEIAADGPITVAQFMARALYDPALGYYRRSLPIGAQGDFITAPEVSQMFGELLGVWTAQVFFDLGRPPSFQVIELGPGRGAMMRDVLRALAAAAPEARPGVALVEVNAALRRLQEETAPGALFVERLEEAPVGACVILANEWLDCLPVRQFVRTPKGWCERLVGLGVDGRLAFGVAREPLPDPSILPAPNAPLGAVAEICPGVASVMEHVAARFAAHPGRALLIDYGGATPFLGDTLQAVRRHAKVDPLADPGEADLTAHVDFAALAHAARTAGLDVHGPTTQGAFLGALGLDVRAAVLARARPDRASAIEAERARLADAAEMGALFKVIALSSPGLPPPPGFS